MKNGRGFGPLLVVLGCVAATGCAGGLIIAVAAAGGGGGGGGGGTTFQPVFAVSQTVTNVGVSPGDVKIGDLDGDGDRDLAVVLEGESKVAFLFNDGTGQFTLSGTKLSVDAAPRGIAIANLGGAPGVGGGPAGDLVVTSQTIENVTRYVNSGDGVNYGPGANFNVESTPQPVVVFDINNDSKQDILVGNQEPDINNRLHVSILYGNAGGTFDAAVPTPDLSYLDGKFLSIAFGDMDDDGNNDIVAADQENSKVVIYRANNDGKFGPPSNPPIELDAGLKPNGVAVAELNRVAGGIDNHNDVVLADEDDGLTPSGVTILLGTGGGAFGAPKYVETGIGPVDVRVHDFNGDGNDDVVVVNFGHAPGSGSVDILISDGAGGFAQRLDVDLGHGSRYAAIGDVDGDGDSDIVVVNTSDNSISILENSSPLSH